MEKQVWCILWLGTVLLIGADAQNMVHTANKYIDDILQQTTKLKADALSSVRLRNFETNNKDKFLFINVKVKTSYTNGRLRNLGSVKRLGDCMPMNPSHQPVKMGCTIQFKDLHIEYNGRMKYGQLPKISITAKATVRPVEVLSVIANNTARGTHHLEAFDVVSAVEIDPSFTGIGLLNRYLKMLKEQFTNYVGLYAEYAVKENFGAALNQTIIANNL